MTAKQQADLATLTTLWFPASTRYIGYVYEEGFLDDWMCAKVEVPKSDLAAFIASSPFADETFRTDRSEVYDSADLSWFRPSTSKDFQTGSVTLPVGRALNILIDHDRGDPVVIYIEWFET